MDADVSARGVRSGTSWSSKPSVNYPLPSSHKSPLFETIDPSPSSHKSPLFETIGKNFFPPSTYLFSRSSMPDVDLILCRPCLVQLTL
uniref:Uncharacterized protein n=1 Tax=Nelumbo nucifera TaxID=4432 RepID=A0A822Y1A4_NELNU|nr:TPA_asm: hypothetical protein HUJ06_026533 [Nelumbo nucifera]